MGQRLDYYEEYIKGRIDFDDIPRNKVGPKLLKKAAELEGNYYAEIIYKYFKDLDIDWIVFAEYAEPNVRRLVYNKMFDLSMDESYRVLLVLHPQIVCNEMYKYDKKKNFLIIPKKYRTIGMCQEMFKLDPLKYFWYIPDEFKTEDMYLKYYELNPKVDIKSFPKIGTVQKVYDKFFIENPENNIWAIPEQFRTQMMYQKLYEINSEKYFVLIPDEFKTEKMCEEMFKKASQKYYEYIPERYLTQEMCDKVFLISSVKYFSMIPDRYKTQTMCDKMFKIDAIQFFEMIPENFRTVDMWKKMLKYNFSKYSKEIPSVDINVDILGVAKLEMLKIYNQNNLYYEEKLSKLERMVIELYSEMKNFKYVSVEELQVIQEKSIKEALYMLISNGGTLEDIAKNLNVNIYSVQSVLEKMKEYDLESYTLIREKLEVNQKSHFFGMLNDVKNLSAIIEHIGNVDRTGIKMEQKLKFAYLCGKYLNNPLEEIYNFNYTKYSKQDTSNITRFFKQVLKFNYIRSDNLTIPEKKTIQFNNSWLSKYNRDKFFAIKNGVVTMERRYGKDSQLLTLEIEERILSVLKLEGIPLYEVIVTNAFKEYFNGTLDSYVEKLKGYDGEFTVSMNKNGVKKI